MKEVVFNGFRTSGFLMLFVLLIPIPALAVALACLTPDYVYVPGLILICLCWTLMTLGFMTLEPNEARVMVFFGKYKGTFSETGFYWVNPFYAKKRLSMRARNLDVPPIKVNDKVGNQVMVGLVLVWKVKDTYKAMFEIDSQTMAKGASVSAGKNEISIESALSRVMNAFENFVKI